MPHAVLLTGGVASGKSSLAERLALLAQGPRYYIATMVPFGVDADLKVARHRKLREGKGFTTIECYTDLASVDLSAEANANDSVVLLECLTNLVANSLYSPEGRVYDEDDVFAEIMMGIENLQRQCAHLIVITNEVGSGGVQYDEGTMAYMRLLGRLNCVLAASFDSAAEVVDGLPCILKGELPWA